MASNEGNSQNQVPMLGAAQCRLSQSHQICAEQVSHSAGAAQMRVSKPVVWSNIQRDHWNNAETSETTPGGTAKPAGSCIQ